MCGKDGAEVSRMRYEKNGWREHGQPRFFDILSPIERARESQNEASPGSRQTIAPGKFEIGYVEQVVMRDGSGADSAIDNPEDREPHLRDRGAGDDPGRDA